MLAEPLVDTRRAQSCNGVRIETEATHDGLARGAVEKVGREVEVREEQRERAMHARLRVDQRDLGVVIDLSPLVQQCVDLGMRRSAIRRPCDATASIA